MRNRGIIVPVLAAVLTGLVLGLGIFTFGYAKGAAYLTNDPAACANCHVMADYYSGWMKGPHRKAAVCNDCHTPHGLAGKYATKASNGFWHSFHFTAGSYPDQLQIKPRNLQIADAACLKCHAEITQAILASSAHSEVGKTACVRCHSDVGHL